MCGCPLTLLLNSSHVEIIINGSSTDLGLHCLMLLISALWTWILESVIFEYSITFCLGLSYGKFDVGSLPPILSWSSLPLMAGCCWSINNELITWKHPKSDDFHGRIQEYDFPMIAQSTNGCPEWAGKGK